jgi:cob(I)alamin adenosyltransferase
VAVIQFFKGENPSGEIGVLRELTGIDIFLFGTGHWVYRGKPQPEDRREARQAWDKAKSILREKATDLLLLDEINNALDLGLIPLGEVLGELKACRGGMEVVLTGRNAPPEIIELGDYVTEMREIKHPYRQGVKARPGIEY